MSQIALKTVRKVLAGAIKRMKKKGLSNAEIKAKLKGKASTAQITAITLDMPHTQGAIAGAVGLTAGAKALEKRKKRKKK